MSEGREAAGPAPLVSVVIPTMNSAALLPRALGSLAAQGFRDFEVVVSDGASRDSTVAVAQGFASALPSLRVDSRPDSGVYDAINRGVRLSRGRWFLVLGSDDLLHAPDTLAHVAAHLAAAGPAAMVHGDVRLMAENRSGVEPGGRFAGPVSLEWLCRANVCQQCIFYRRELFDRLGGFDLRYRLYADWDFNLRAAFEAPLRWMDLVIADYAATGMSASAEDPVFLRDKGELIRTRLEARPHDQRLWPAQRRLLTQARQSRKAGRRAEAWRLRASFLRLLVQRLPVLLGRRR